MFWRVFMKSALVAFVAALVASAAVLPEYLGQEARVVEFTTVPSTAGAASAPMGALEASRAHADEHGLTDCVEPAHARLDDVILTFPSEPVAGAVVTPVGFDEALESGELGRWNVLACKPAGQAS